MPWRLTVWTPNKSTQKAQYQPPTSTGGIDHTRPMRWKLRGDGNPLELRFFGQPSLLDIAAGDIVRLEVQDSSSNWHAVFYGYMDTAYNSQETRIQEYVAIGGFELLRSVWFDAGYELQNINNIALNVGQNFGHPALSATSGDFPNPGQQIAIEFGSFANAADVLEGLARSIVASPPWTARIDGNGNLTLSPRPTTERAIGYRESGFSTLPSRASNIYTEGIAVAYTGGASRERFVRAYETINPGGIILPYKPNAIAASVQSSLHGTYKRSRVEVFPGDPFVLTTPSAATGSGFANANNVRDGNNSTYANNTGGVSSLEATLNRPIYGVEIVYEILGSYQAILSVRRTSLPSGFQYDDYVTYQLERTSQISTFYAIAPVSGIHNNQPFNQSTIAITIDAPSDSIRIYEIRMIELSPTVTEFARSLIAEPVSIPSEVRWSEFFAPTANLRIINAPGGDIVAPVETWEGVIQKTQTVWIARIGDTGANEDGATLLRALNQSANIATINAQTLLSRR